MKRVFLISLFIVILFPFTNVKASCDFNEQYKLNIIGSNIKYTYKYVKNNTIFDVTLYNVRKEVYLEYNNKIYNPNNGEVVLKNIDGSEENSVNVKASSNTNCKGEFINIVPIKLPRYNEYFGSEYCVDNIYHKYCARYIDSGIDINKIEMEMEDNSEEDVEAYLKSRKDEKITIKIKTTAKDIFTKKNMILMVLIILLVLIIIALIKKFREIVKLKF